MREAPAWIDTVKAWPGDWALVQTYGPTSSVAAYARAKDIRNGSSHCYAPAGSFDATVRKVEGEYELWVAYLGDTETTDA
jgi:hypothetical protein